MDDARAVAVLLREAARRIGGRTPRLDAELLLAHAAGVAREQLLLQPAAPGPEALRRFWALVARRARGEPVAYLLGRAEFRSLMLEVDHRVLVPRPASETLIEAAEQAFGGAGPGMVVDLGVGSGALLAAALVRWPAARGVGVDRSGAALALARRNLAALGLSSRASLIRSDWAAALAVGRFDLVLANPPYVALGEGDPGLAWEPAEALFAGPDGLDEHRRLVPQLARLLRPGALAVIEVGQGQAAEVLGLGHGSGLEGEACPDLGGIERAIRFRVRRPAGLGKARPTD